jgi:homoserine kinase
VAIGFDILGFAVGALGDRVTATRRAARGVEITAVRGIAGDLAREPRHNTAGQALLALVEAVQPDFGFSIELAKGIPLGSGLGGSAASAVAAVVAGNALLPQGRDRAELLKFALAGEAVASGSRHMDNIAPSLYGGLVLTVGIDHPRVKQIPVPPGVRAVVVHPHVPGDQQGAGDVERQRGDVGLCLADRQPAGFISGC